MSNNVPFKQSIGNALSDQPEAVRRDYQARLDAAFGPVGGTRPADRDLGALSGLFGPEVQFLLNALANTIRAGLARSPREVMDRGDMKRPYVLGPGGYEYFPTWSFWGSTKVHLHNTGSLPTTILVNEVRIQLEPGQEKDEEGRWAAFPVRVVNTNESVGSEVTVVVS
jgi:hypothetical protein